jgi:hypothetical protein
MMSAQIVRNIAIYRCIIFGILVYEWNHYLPASDGSVPTDDWFVYDQFEFLMNYASYISSPIITVIGNVFGVLAVLGGIPGIIPFEVAGLLTVVLYLSRFLMYVQIFTNHNYLFPMLGFLTVLSGGGSLRGGVSKNEKGASSSSGASSDTKTIQRCEWIAIAIRMQYAVLYFFASIWKTHPDWFQGHIVKGIFLSFEDSNVARGIPWHAIYEYFPSIFVLVALGGFILDAGMFLALTIRRPSPETSTMFTTLSVLFHAFVSFTMSQRIGYAFPLSCLAGSVIFQPIGTELATSKKDDDLTVTLNNVETSLIGWTKRYITGKDSRATRWQRLFTLTWLFCQLALPLRMPIISKGAFPYTSQCYRFSWTMMLHGRSTMVQHKGSARAQDGTAMEKLLPLEFMYILPECRGSPLQRKNYMPESANPFQDPRTLPLNHMLAPRHFALINVFPRYISRIAGGMSEMLFKMYPTGCQGDKLSMYGVHFAKLNDNGAFHRMFDPTVDLAAADRQRANRTWNQLWTDVLFDQAPGGRNEYLLSAGIGGSKGKVANYTADIRRTMPHVKRVEFIADRSACLAARPLDLWLGGFPLGVMPMEVPENFSIYLQGRQQTGPISPETQLDGLSEPQRVSVQLGKLEQMMATSVEIGITAVGKTSKRASCADSDAEDVIFALLFMV